MTAGLAKAHHASCVQGVRRAMRLTDRLAKVHAYSHLEGANGRPMADDENLTVDSPTTVNHYHPAPQSPWPWLGAAGIAAAIVALVLLWPRGGSIPVIRPPARSTDFIEFYRP